MVGTRYFHESGELEDECPFKDGLVHGVRYRADTPGRLLSAEPFANGLPHGTARQWSAEGQLLGTYRMKRGTGTDLWWCDNSETGPYLSEARFVKDGRWHGFEWWLKEDQTSIWQERHFRNDELHGIERCWNSNGRLRRGYPKYHVNNFHVTKREYLRACAADPTLPHFRPADDLPQRTFPPEVLAGLRYH